MHTLWHAAVAGVLLGFVICHDPQQWQEYLKVLADERICASCWAGMLKKYLSRQHMQARMIQPERSDYEKLLATSKDCRCDFLTDEEEVIEME